MQLIEKYAKENEIPIIQKESLKFIENLINEKKIKNILEIGSAIGYSAIKMALVSDEIKVLTLEKDETRFIEAKKNIEKMKLCDRITILNVDAKEFILDEQFDLIFIDAAKSSNLYFFEKYKKNLKQNGIIITDNINFHNLKEEEIENKNLKRMVKKTREYREFLIANEEFETVFIEIGDGLSISQRRG